MQVALWTDERVEQLKKLWEQGSSASQIAGEMGGISRNAVIGKVHRLGLQGRVKAPAAAAKSAKPAEKAKLPTSFGGMSGTEIATLNRPQEMIAYPDNVIPMQQRVDITGLRDTTCRWPVGDPQKDDFYFCGGKSNGTPYCPVHAKMAYQPAGERRREMKRAS